MLQQDTPEDFVIATGVTTSVRDFVRMSFAEAGIEIEFTGSGVNEKGIILGCSNPDYQISIGTTVITVDERYFRPAEVEILIGDATKAKNQLGWTPTYTLNELVSEMVAYDLDLFKKEKHLIDSGFQIKASIEH
jgi:GDPmannose 4,6-dehydratase